jgi:KRAB domain-containing zinc finger protein
MGCPTCLLVFSSTCQVTCKLCDLSFSVENDFQNHMLNEHEQLALECKRSPVKEFYCQVCQFLVESASPADHFQLKHEDIFFEGTVLSVTVVGILDKSLPSQDPAATHTADKEEASAAKIVKAEVDSDDPDWSEFGDGLEQDNWNMSDEDDAMPRVKGEVLAPKIRKRDNTSRSAKKRKLVTEEDEDFDDAYGDIFEPSVKLEVAKDGDSGCEDEDKKLEKASKECLICKDSFKNLQLHYAKVHPDINTKNVVCPDCKRKVKNLINHKCGEKEARCKYCLKSMKWEQSFEAHVNECHKDALYLHSCRICSAFFPTTREMSQHIELDHKEDPYPCPLCDLFFKTCVMVQTHVEKDHNATVLSCEKCGDKLQTVASLRYHDFKRHLRTQPAKECYICEYCGMEQRNEDFALHMKGKHQEFLAKYTCPICNAISRSIRHHVLMHEDSGICCDICGKRFKNSRKLGYHIKNIHSTQSEEVFQCDSCDFTTNRDSYLKSHVRHVHGEKKFVCDLCGAAFGWNQSLQRHVQRVHDKDFPFQCDECQRWFPEKNVLEKHKKTKHKGMAIKTTKCPTCYRRYEKLENLEKHLEHCDEVKKPKYRKRPATLESTAAATKKKKKPKKAKLETVFLA